MEDVFETDFVSESAEAAVATEDTSTAEMSAETIEDAIATEASRGMLDATTGGIAETPPAGRKKARVRESLALAFGVLSLGSFLAAIIGVVITYVFGTFDLVGYGISILSLGWFALPLTSAVLAVSARVKTGRYSILSKVALLVAVIGGLGAALAVAAPCLLTLFREFVSFLTCVFDCVFDKGCRAEFDLFEGLYFVQRYKQRGGL